MLNSILLMAVNRIDFNNKALRTEKWSLLYQPFRAEFYKKYSTDV